jgi:hypothetical protein
MRQVNASGRQYQSPTRTAFTEVQIRKFADHRDPDNLMNLILGRAHTASNAATARFQNETPPERKFAGAGR